MENATACVIPGDVTYAWLKAGREYGFPEDVQEIAWFYDRGARPSHPDGPIPQNIFGRIVGDPTKFYNVCRRMVCEGAKQVEITRVEDGA